MITEIIRYNIAPGREAQFEEAYGQAQQYLDASQHCIAYELLRCIEEPGRFLLRIEWDSVEGHLSGFRGSPDFQKFFAAVRPYFSAIEEMQHYELTSVYSALPREQASSGI